MARGTLKSVLVCFVFLRVECLAFAETKIEKLQLKDHFWGALVGIGGAQSQLDGPPTGQNLKLAGLYLQSAEYHFEAIASKFGRSSALYKASFASLKERIYHEKLENMSVALRNLQIDILKDVGEPFAPVETPKLSRGMGLFATHCASCHGLTGRGDGALTAKLTRKPRPFSESWRDRSFTPLYVIATMIHGVEKTEMVSMVDSLDYSDMWAVSFFVSTLRWPQKDEVHFECSIAPLQNISFKLLARMSNLDLSELFHDAIKDCPSIVPAARMITTFENSLPRETRENREALSTKVSYSVAAVAAMLVLASAGFIFLLRRRG